MIRWCYQQLLHFRDMEAHFQFIFVALAYRNFLDYICIGCMFFKVDNYIRLVFYMLKPFYGNWCVVLDVERR